MPYYQQKKRVAINPRSSTTVVATRVRANKRVRVNDLDINMNDQVPKTMFETPFPFLELPGGESSCPFFSVCG
jgi:hypothetical protein